MLKLKQGQLWKTGDRYLRIVHLERLEVKYKEMSDPASVEGTHHHVSKKEFCRLLKGATLVPVEVRQDDREEGSGPRRDL
jgi:hypothetical protein